jgi:hypothetical protein
MPTMETTMLQAFAHKRSELKGSEAAAALMCIYQNVIVEVTQCLTQSDYVTWLAEMSQLPNDLAAIDNFMVLSFYKLAARKSSKTFQDSKDLAKNILSAKDVFEEDNIKNMHLIKIMYECKLDNLYYYPRSRVINGEMIRLPLKEGPIWWKIINFRFDYLTRQLEIGNFQIVYFFCMQAYGDVSSDFIKYLYKDHTYFFNLFLYYLLVLDSSKDKLSFCPESCWEVLELETPINKLLSHMIRNIEGCMKSFIFWAIKQNPDPLFYRVINFFVQACYSLSGVNIFTLLNFDHKPINKSSTTMSAFIQQTFYKKRPTQELLNHSF